MAWIKTVCSVRNQLACFLRTVTGLMDMCCFLWAGAALIGIHITSPFMSMLLEHKVPPRRLLKVLPKLYNELCTYPKSLISFETCGIPALAEFYGNPFKKKQAVME